MIANRPAIIANTKTNKFFYTGLVTTLSGLNISNNPLEFPPESVIEGGTKSILAFFRDLLRAKSKAGYGSSGWYLKRS